MRRVLLLLICLAALLARADTPVAVPLPGGSPEYPFLWQVATNGEGYLLAWTSETRAHLALVDDAGAVVRETAFDVTGGVADVIAVRRDYLVMIGSTIYVVDPDTLVVKDTRTTPFARNSTFAADGSTALLASYYGYARLLDAGGNATGIDLRFSNTVTYNIGAAAAHGHYLVVWRDNDRLMRTVISNRGEVVSSAATLVTIDAVQQAFGRGSVASDGETFVVAWRSGNEIDFMRVGADGTVLSAPAKLAQWDYTDAPQVVWNGRDFLVVLETRTLADPDANVIALRLNGDAVPVAGGPQLQYRPAAASNGRSTLAVWGELANCYQAGFGGVMGRAIEPAGPVMTLSRGDAVQENPAALTVGSATLVAWVERNAVRHVRALLNGTPIDIPATSYAQLSPAIGSNGTSFLLVWPELYADCSSSLSAVVITRDGRVGEVHTVAQDAHPETRPSIAWNGSEYAVLWERRTVAQALAIRVSAGGAPLDAKPVAVTPEYPNPTFYTHRTLYPSIVWTGSAYLALWTFSRTAYIPLYPSPTPSTWELRARRFDRNLTPLEAEHTLATSYMTAFGWNGTEGLAMWAWDGKFHASRVSAGGALLDTHDLFPVQAVTLPPSSTVVWTGHDWLAAVGRDLARIRPDGTLDARTTINDETWASTVTPQYVVYQNAKGQVLTRAVDWTKRRSSR